jgi:hypothetical protein
MGALRPAKTPWLHGRLRLVGPSTHCLPPTFRLVSIALAAASNTCTFRLFVHDDCIAIFCSCWDAVVGWLGRLGLRWEGREVAKNAPPSARNAINPPPLNL